MIEWISPLLLLMMLLASLSLNFYQWQQLRRKEHKHATQLEYQKKSASEVKSRFIANISHEIRTPLNAILGHTQLLERDPQMNDEQLHSLSTILKSSTHLSDLINDLLEIASLESHTMALQCKDFDLADMVTGLSNLFAKRCAQKQLRWRYINTQSGSIEVNGDMAKIRQILVKLLGNAVKFTHTGQITLSIAHEHHNFCFTIEDTGPGIAEDQQHNIFKIFTQQSDQVGVGLGLAIAKSEIELMGGQLELQSKPGKGCCFSFTLCLEPAFGQVNQRTIRGRKVSQLTPTYLTEQNEVRIFVVDHCAQTREILTKMLRNVGIVVSHSENGEQALDQLKQLSPQQLPHLLLFDIDILLQDDSQYLAQIQNSFDSDTMQFVILCATGIQGQIKTLLSLYGKVDENNPLDFQNFIAKPYRFEAVYELVHQLLHVDFDYQNEQTKVISKSIDYINHPLPGDLLCIMQQAAAVYEIGILEDALTELKNHSEDNRAMADHLNSFITHYDMEGLLTELDKAGKVHEHPQHS